MTRIAVGSRNPAKVEPVRAVASVLLGDDVEVAGVDVDSGVSAQPRTDAEALRGAENRARAALAASAGASLGVGIEGGVMEVEGRLFGGSWVAVADREGRIARAATARFELPDGLAAALRAGREMGDAVGDAAGRADVRRREGAMGLLTAGRVTRATATEQALHFAFARLLGAHGL